MSLLDRMSNTAKKQMNDKQNDRDERTKPIQVSESLYKKLKIKSAYKNIPIKQMADKAIRKALDDKLI